jgi:ABC-2 type transport system ATP-binding protein
MTEISFESVSKQFGPVQAVRDLTMTVPSGTVTAFLGPNGAGKTTAVRVLLGLVRPTSGRALIGGRPYDELADPRRTVGAMLGSESFHPARTGRNHLRAIARAAAICDVRVDEVLGLVELEHAARRRVGGYSLGMRQRLGLAAALLGDPEVFVADEPANGLDPEGIAWLRGFLRSMAGEGRTVLVSSHQLAEVSRTADAVAVISEGTLRYNGPMSGLGKPEELEAAFLRLTSVAA